MGRIIGIDLGTTNSAVAVVENGEAVMIPVGEARTMPSVVAFTRQGERLVGEAAKRQAVTNADRTFFSIKRQMGTDWSVNIDGARITPQEISAMILSKLKEAAQEYLGQEVSEAVITVPAYFNDVQRQATKDAGRIAGLTVKRIINEPTSAALSYGLDHALGEKIMVFDLGGGTFDVSIIEICEGTIEVLATRGDNHLGGDDFTERIVTEIVARFKRQHGVNLSSDPVALSRVREGAEAAKKALSTGFSAPIYQPFIYQSPGMTLHLDETITRDQFSSLTEDLVKRTEGPVRMALSDAGLSPKDLNKVLLVGGSTRIPAVQQVVQSLTGLVPSKGVNPDEVVARGAAIQGNILEGKPLTVGSTGTELLLFDVTPLSLSIETVGGIATELIHRNATIPTRFSKIFTTAAPLQTSVEINVLQGERPMARDNKSIGKFKLSGIRPSMPGIPQIEVTFDIDVNGILKVSAKDLATGKQQSVTISAGDRMREDEIQDAIYRARAYASVDAPRKEALALMEEGRKLINRLSAHLKQAGNTLDKAYVRELQSQTKILEKEMKRIKVDKVTMEEVSSLRDALQRVKDLAGNLGDED